jgi:hypothetical protein
MPKRPTWVSRPLRRKVRAGFVYRFYSSVGSFLNRAVLSLDDIAG